MIRNSIASRKLQCKIEDGKFISFDIEIGAPFLTGEKEYCCEIYSHGILFQGVKRAFGLDAIDCLDCALQMIDLITSMRDFGDIRWPDGSMYTRVPSSQKMGWA